MIIFKVVKWSKSRKCYVSCLAFNKYMLEYIEGKITRAIKGTPVMCFDTFNNANQFMEEVFTGEEIRKFKIKVIKVKSIGKRIIPRYYTDNYDDDELDKFYENLKKWAEGHYLLHYSYSQESPNRGTVCYPAVKVLGFEEKLTELEKLQQFKRDVIAEISGNYCDECEKIDGDYSVETFYDPEKRAFVCKRGHEEDFECNYRHETEKGLMDRIRGIIEALDRLEAT